MTRTWTAEDVDVLRYLWWNHTPKEVFSLFPKYSEKAIRKKVWSLGIPRAEETFAKMKSDKTKLLVMRNTEQLGRARNKENARVVALQYVSRTEFYRKDLSMYTYIRNNGLWGALCSHIREGRFNYSETFLFVCLKEIYPQEVMLRNSRRIIAPYEIDIYLPSLRLGFEYDGSLWHAKEDAIRRDHIKDERCRAENIRLVRIKEIRKDRHRPESFIISQLASNGFSITGIDIVACQNTAYAMGCS